MLIFNALITGLGYLMQDLILDLPYWMYPAGLLITYYSVSETFHLLDNLVHFKKYKIPSNLVTDKSWKDLYQVTLRNNLCMAPGFVAYKLLILDTGLVNPTSPIYLLVPELLFYSLVYLAVFEVGHRLLHTKNLYKYHKQHHLTYADKAVTAHYMNPIDFFFEVPLPFFTGPFLLAKFYKASYLSFIIWGGVGTLDGLITHSGYDFGVVISAKEHHAHHVNKLIIA